MEPNLRPDYSSRRKRYQLYVLWVDHAETLEDRHQEGITESLAPTQGRNLHIGGWRLDGEGSGPTVSVMMSVDLLGDFKVPKPGDVIWVEESYRTRGEPPVYLYSTYNSLPLTSPMANPVPMWGGIPGDYGHIRSYKDHVAQFSAENKGANFLTKFVKSITGYRWRSFYRGSLIRGRYAYRGDPIFDINPDENNQEVVIENGTHIGYGGPLKKNKGDYPNPLNAPKQREEDETYLYVVTHHRYLNTRINPNPYDNSEQAAPYSPKREKIIYKNKNYFAYQPILDKDHLDRTSFEREVTAAEEYILALRGNNKLVISDQYGDGEQILITLKNQYDAGITILHNAERGQVRIRDHLGQGVLIEADPDEPRVIAWTKNRQVVEMGSIAGEGSFTYLRNGDKFGDADTSYGEKTGLTKNDVSNQEILMVSSSSVVGHLASRLSAGMLSLASGKGAGIFMRNNIDPESKKQDFAMYQNGPVVTTEHLIETEVSDQASIYEKMVVSPGNAETLLETKINYNLLNVITTDVGKLQVDRHDGEGTHISQVKLDNSSINIEPQEDGVAINISVAENKDGKITIGNPNTSEVVIESQHVQINTSSMDISQL